jgi:hypothetical protein
MQTGPCRDKWNLAAPEGEILFSSCDDERSRRAVNRDSARRRAATLGGLPTGKPGGSKAHRRNAPFLDAPATHPFSGLLCWFLMLININIEEGVRFGVFALECLHYRHICFC